MYSLPLSHNCSRCPSWAPASLAGSSGRSQRWRMMNTWRGRRRRSCSRESGSSSKDQCRSHCYSDCWVSWHWWGYCEWKQERWEMIDVTTKRQKNTEPHMLICLYFCCVGSIKLVLFGLGYNPSRWRHHRDHHHYHMYIITTNTMTKTQNYINVQT